MHRELKKVNSAIEYLAKLENSYSDKTFGLDKANIKNLSKTEIEIARRQQSAAKDQALAKWANYDGSNSYLQVLHDKDIGKFSHGGKAPGGRGFLGIGTLKDWTFGQQNFNLNSDGSRYKTGHVAGMLSSSAALEELRADQAWIINILGQGRITKQMYDNMPYAVRHLSGSRSIERQFGSIGDPVIPNPLQIGNKGNLLSQNGMVNPFYDANYVKYDYDTHTKTVTKRGKILGILPYSRRVTTKGTINYNIPEHRFFTNHFGDSRFRSIGADSNTGTGVAVTKSIAESNNNVLGFSRIKNNKGEPAHLSETFSEPLGSKSTSGSSWSGANSTWTDRYGNVIAPHTPNTNKRWSLMTKPERTEAKRRGLTITDFD